MQRQVRCQWLFWPALILALVIFAAFRVIDAPLQNSVAPNGIVSFELAGSVALAQAMLDSWDTRTRLYAAFGLGLDYLFMPSYALAIGLGCLRAAGVLGRRWHRAGAVGRILAWGLLPAALLDGIENVALTRMLLAGAATAPWPALAAICAAIKFALIALGLLYALAGALAFAVRTSVR